jgi:hypothetical protein
MSKFFPANKSVGFYQRDDSSALILLVSEYGTLIAGFCDPQPLRLFPRSRLVSGDLGTPMSYMEDMLYMPMALSNDYGSQAYLKFAAYDFDSTGATPIAGATISAFLTANNLFVGSVVSDANGYFELPSQYASQNHFLVGYKTGSPNLSGSTVNTLQPS